MTNKYKHIVIIFNSPIMHNDKLRLENKTIEEARKIYLDWWASYGRTEEEALDNLVDIILVKGEEDDY